MYRKRRSSKDRLERPSSDDVLYRQLSEREPDAIATVFERYSDFIYSIALRIVHDTELAEDVLQDVFLHFLRRPEVFDGGRGNLGGWLATIAKHRSIDLLRARKPVLPLVDIAEPCCRRAAKDLAGVQRLAVIERLIACLPPEQRKSIELAFREDLTHVEICVLTGGPTRHSQDQDQSRAFNPAFRTTNSGSGSRCLHHVMRSRELHNLRLAGFPRRREAVRMWSPGA